MSSCSESVVLPSPGPRTSSTCPCCNFSSTTCAARTRVCKSDRVQSKLAYLNGNLFLVEAVVGLVFAFPFGVLADIVGRKPMIMLSTVGSLLSLAWMLVVISLPRIIPVEFIVAGPLFTAVGGGSTIVVANLYSLLSDMVSETERASAFFFMGFASLSGASIGPALSSKLMDTFSPWVPALLGFFAVPIGVSGLIFVPEAPPRPQQDSSSEEEHAESDEPQQTRVKSHIGQSVRLLKASFTMLQSPSIVLILATFLALMPELLATSQFYAQYVSKRFDWSLAKAGYLLTVRGIIQMVVLLVALPLLSKLLLRWQRPAVKDLTFARFSFTFAATGALFMAASGVNTVVFGLSLNTFAGGASPLCRSLATSYMDPQDLAKLNTMIGIVESAGALFAGPALAWLFSTGMKWGGEWLGLPYLGLAALLVLGLLALFFVRAPQENKADDGNRETEGFQRGDSPFTEDLGRDA
ncbi:MFS general substrate transporter [Aspergillus ellipticus CBS 707.79]|uniref:MFS general substrate transporter n=1 Tax=Aspergillus ellipticus CBS 707.79 TaxID=1448320 RepID=A0A319DVW9_9EURO|nr:MFS general substrate transporter [Aspergillus ellipticus CBS 707.79]